MTERVLVPSVAPELLLVAVAMRVFRDPVLAVDATNEALATRGVADGQVEALEILGGIVRVADRLHRVSSVERSRLGRTHTVGLGPAERAEVTELASLVLRLSDDVMDVIQCLERDAPPLARRRQIASSGLVLAVEDREHHGR